MLTLRLWETTIGLNDSRHNPIIYSLPGKINDSREERLQKHCRHIGSGYSRAYGFQSMKSVDRCSGWCMVIVTYTGWVGLSIIRLGRMGGWVGWPTPPGGGWVGWPIQPGGVWVGACVGWPTPPGRGWGGPIYLKDEYRPSKSSSPSALSILLDEPCQTSGDIAFLRIIAAQLYGVLSLDIINTSIFLKYLYNVI